MILEAGGQGRVISYDMASGVSEVLLDGLFFPNGIALSPDEEFLVISETTASRIMRYTSRYKSKINKVSRNYR